MNLVKSLMIAGLVFSSAQAFAHEGKNSACKQFWESCKTTKGKKAKMACVKDAAAADTTDGPACTAEMAAHKEKHDAKKANSDATAPTATSGSTAN